MMKYNTKRKQLPLPEYGRAVQKMVDHALTIEDRAERQRCAQAIIDIMGNMYPQLRDTPDFNHKLWDHLAIMSDFELDIEYPYVIIKPEEFKQAPSPLAYSKGSIRLRHYGHIVQELIEAAVNMEEGEQRDQLVHLIAIQMKKDYIAWNKEGVEDSKIFEDLLEYSRGKIALEGSGMKIDVVAPAPQQQQRPARNQQQHRKTQNTKRKY